MEELFIKRRRPALIYGDAKRREKETDLGGDDGIDERMGAWKEGGTEGKRVSQPPALPVSRGGEGGIH